MLRLKLASRAAKAPGTSMIYAYRRIGLRVLLCCLALAAGVLLVLPSLAGANPITDENAKAGSSGWEVTLAGAGLIDGYSDKSSIAPGEALPFRVSATPSASYRINIYRLGWYGGTGARLVACLPSCTTNATGSARTTPSPNAQTGEIDDTNNGASSWPISQTLSTTTTANFTTGEYIAEYVLKSGSESGNARYSPFVVRSNAPLASASSILVIVPVNTYNAYNDWGNTNAYVNNTNKSIFSGNHAYKVSFNRPTYRREWRNWDLPMLRFLEREGYDVSYATDTDVDASPQILQQHQAVIVSGHSEYWTRNMRDGFDAARDAGTNLFFAGANDAYWQVRYEDSSCADDNTVCGTVGDRRTMVIYKQETGDATDPISNSTLTTIKWRDLGQPECSLQGGVQYGSWFPNDGYRNYTTTTTGATDPWATGTGLSNGSTITGLVGFEFDSYLPSCSVPGTPKILFQYQGPETAADIDAAAVGYTANGSGARVFSSGSEQWAWGLDSYRWDPTLFTGIPATNPAIQQYTRNILTDMQKPAAPGVTATRVGNSFQIDTTPLTDPRITSYKIYRHAGSGTFQPSDPGVTLVCQNASGDCTDSPAQGAYRYASVAVDQWNDSAAALSQAVDNFTPPTAVDDSATVSEDAAATSVPVTSNDTNPSGQPITITAVTQATNGTVAITGGGTGLTYRPTANYCNNPPGTSLDTFTYTINGGTTATVSMTVTCVDDAPVAVHDSKSVVEDDPATAVGVLANDTDIDGGTKEVASFTQPTHGTVTGVGTAGHWTDVSYQPNANYCNFVNGHPELAGPTDSFNYTLNGGSSTNVTVTVDCRDDPANANDDSATVTEDASATAIPVLSNDSDVEGDPFSITAVTQGAHGAVQITGGGTGLTYQPTADYCGADTFTYTVTGGDTATVSMTVTCVDDLPVASNDSKTVAEDDPATALTVLANDNDIDGGPKEITSFTQPAHGTVTGVGTSGHWSDVRFQPTANYCNNPPGTSPDTFQYTINGGTSATVSVTINCVDDPPVPHNDAGSVSEDAAATAIDVLSNDTDIDGGPKTINSVTQPNNGTVAITGGGAGLTYQPNPNYCNNNGGTADKFTYTLNGGSAATVSMTVFCVDDAPVAVHDSKSAVEDDPATAVDVLANDTDVDAGPKTVASVTQPAHGTVVRNGDGSGLTYQPNANYCNFVSGHPELSGPSDDFNYTLNGGSTASVSMTVDCVDDPPVANDDSPTVTEDASATAIPVMSNDTDVDGGPMGILSVTQPANGTVDTSGGGAVLTYKPNANYCNTPPGTTKDTFTYTLNGGDSATVSMTVTCVDDSPTAVNDSATVTEDASATSISVLGNDTDIDGGPKTINSVNTTGTHGTVAITGGGSGLTYRPNANYCNTPSDPADTFTYTLNGGSSATVSMTVTCVDDPPTAVNDSDTVTGNSGPNSIGVLPNDTDVDGGPKSISSFTQPSHGVVAGTGPTNAWTDLTYDPTQGYCGSDSFTYTLNGGSSATVSITVDCSGAPSAVNDTATFTEDDPATAINVIANDTDTDGGTNTIQSVTQPVNGTVAITNGGADLTYKPNANYCNTQTGGTSDQFNYTLNGGSTGTVSVTVTCVNDDPTAANDSATVTEDAAATAIPVLTNDNDPEGDAITVSSVTQPAHGTVVRNSDGSGLTYQPNANYCNTPPGTTKDTFTYTVNGSSANKTATVSMAVTCVDDPPTAVDDSFTVLGESSANDLAILANDTDIDGGPKSITGVTQPDNGTVNQTGSTSLTYTPDPGYCSPPSTTDDFTYTLAGGSTATVHVTADCSQPPTAVDDSATVNEDATATAVNVFTNDTDPDGGQKTIQSVTQPTHGAVVRNSDGSGLTYQPNANYCNTPPGTTKDTFTYTLNGGDSATVSMTVNCVDDLPTAVNDSASVSEGDGAKAIDVRANDTDVDGGPKTINNVTDGAHGTVSITGGGTGLTYTLDESYCNDATGPPASPSDSFTYTLNGGSTGTVSVTIVCVDDDPLAVDDSPAVAGNSGANPLNVLSNDTDIDAGPKAISSFTAPDHGSVSGTGGSTNAWTGLTYTPDHGYCGSDSFDYTLTPGGDTATVSVNVDCSTPPTANDDAATVQHDAPATLIDVRANDTDIDGGPMTITSIIQPPHGTATINFDNTALSYQPNAGYCNTPSGPTDNFTYTLNGGPTATVFMTVVCAPAPPNTTPQQSTTTVTKKCKKGFKKVKGKCKKKRKRR